MRLPPCNFLQNKVLDNVRCLHYYSRNMQANGNEGPAVKKIAKKSVKVARAKRAQPWIDRGGRVLATGLAGANKADLVVVESRPRSR